MPTDPRRLDTVSRLMRGLAYDLDRLLARVLAAAQLVEGELRPEQSRARDYLEELQIAARRAEGTIRRVVAFAERHRGAATSVPLQPMVCDLVDMLRDLLPERLTVRCVGPAEDVLTGVADPAAVEQVVAGLLTDSRDALSGGGEVEVVLWRVTVGPEDAAADPAAVPGEYVGFSVRDGGDGPRPGLTAARPLVRALGGFVTEERLPGGGTTVRVHLRAASAGEVSRTGS